MLAKWRPNPALFLVDSAWFAWVGTTLGVRVMLEGYSKFWLLLVALLVYGAVTGVRHFIRFRGVKLNREPQG
jgi:hypothetical protein